MSSAASSESPKCSLALSQRPKSREKRLAGEQYFLVDNVSVDCLSIETNRSTCVGYLPEISVTYAKGVAIVDEEKTISREKAITWWAVLFMISVFGTAFVMWKWYPTKSLLRLVPLYSALFVCSSIMGTRADREALRQSIGAGLKALIEPAPMLALGVLALEVLVLVLLGFSWAWRSIAPIGLGVLAGAVWARQGPGAPPGKDEKDKVEPVDLWKP